MSYPLLTQALKQKATDWSLCPHCIVMWDSEILGKECWFCGLIGVAHSYGPSLTASYYCNNTSAELVPIGDWRRLAG